MSSPLKLKAGKRAEKEAKLERAKREILEMNWVGGGDEKGRRLGSLNAMEMEGYAERRKVGTRDVRRGSGSRNVGEDDDGMLPLSDDDGDLEGVPPRRREYERATKDEDDDDAMPGASDRAGPLDGVPDNVDGLLGISNATLEDVDVDSGAPDGGRPPLGDGLKVLHTEVKTFTSLKPTPLMKTYNSKA
jgi:hypothetical protein